MRTQRATQRRQIADREAAVIGDYRQLRAPHLVGELFDGRLYPTRNHQRAMGSEQVLTVRDPDFDEIDPSVYALPETIRTLAGATPQP